MSLSAIPKPLREFVWKRDGGRCQYCRLSQLGQGSMFHINHVIPRSRGGATEPSNLVLQCPWCSLHKADKMTAVDPESGVASPLFHPLQQSWEEHFRRRADGIWVGLSPIGRATIVALAMNDWIPRIARAEQIRGGLITGLEEQ